MKMRKILIRSAVAVGLLVGLNAVADDLVILHTNDTHSAIDPDADGNGGVLQRKALIDSVRAAEKNVVLVDAGDIVQGTLYFKFFRGDVEYPLMNMMGYDIQILGNHEFDNGMDEMIAHYRTLDATPLSANYDFTGTVGEGVFQPYTIKEIDGKKIGFIGINLNPHGIIASTAYEGMDFKPIVETANQYAAELKQQGCDLVVVVSHIGAVPDGTRPTDYDIARQSKDIDVIIGGHSHTTILPDNASEKFPSIVANEEGRPVRIAQTGKYGRNLGYIKIPLDNLTTATPADFKYQLIPVTDRFPAESLDSAMIAHIAPYREQLRAVDEHVIAHATDDMMNGRCTGAFVNWTADFAEQFGRHVADSLRAAGHDIPQLDFAMMNVGGIRHPMKAGDVTEGQILATFPFNNKMVLSAIKGQDFIEAMQIAASKHGEAVSDAIRVVTDDYDKVIRVVVNGEEMDPEKTYLMSTIDYLAWGNDDFEPLAKGEILWMDTEQMSVRMLEYLQQLTSLGLPVAGDPRPRFLRSVNK